MQGAWPPRSWPSNGFRPLPARYGAPLCAGHYEVIAMLPDDFSSAKGSLFVLQPGTKAVVFDLDGTITVGDSQVSLGGGGRGRAGERRGMGRSPGCAGVQRGCISLRCPDLACSPMPLLLGMAEPLFVAASRCPMRRW